MPTQRRMEVRHNRTMSTEWFGYAAAILTTGSFIPQAIKTLRSRNTAGISLAMYVVFTIGVALWLVYGVYLVSWPMIFANTVTLLLSVSILILKLRYG
jgi:MtN3 and saliva related transmembrane protein